MLSSYFACLRFIALPNVIEVKLSSRALPDAIVEVMLTTDIASNITVAFTTKGLIDL